MTDNIVEYDWFDMQFVYQEQQTAYSIQEVIIIDQSKLNKNSVIYNNY